MKMHETKQAPAAIGPYSQAYEVNGVLYISGQLPVHPESGEIASTVTKQAEQSCENVQAILTAAGLNLQHVFKTSCFLTDMSNFKEFNQVYGKYFTSKPARSCIAVRELPKGVLCEIEAMAVTK